MIRLLIAGLFAYATYRVTRKIVDEVPDDVRPLPMRADEQRSLRRQSAAMGVEPRR